MRLNRNIIKNPNNFDLKDKFLNCSISTLKRGDYIQIYFVLYDTKKRGGLTSRINKLTAILLKKKVRTNNISILVSTMYKNEKVKWRFILNAPQFVSLKFLRKSLNQINLINL